MDAPTENTANAFNMMQSITEANQKLAKEFLKKFSPDQKFEANELMQSLTAGVMHDTEQLRELQRRYAQMQSQLWTTALQRAAGQEVEPVVAPEKGDRRFHAAGVERGPLFRLPEAILPVEREVALGAGRHREARAPQQEEAQVLHQAAG